ncbi:MAG: nucleoside hydrolase [Anaerolineae bacterium]|jgi:purine nucleosidase|nr:nucleoside hydrolase [Chloroflexota bacterium]
MQPLAPDRRLALLAPPRGRIRYVMDTDTYNEIDDQFALVYALLSPEHDLQAVYAAPFFNDRSTGPADGMEKSYAEILHILGLHRVPHEGLAFRGSTAYLSADKRPVESAAARDLIARARSSGPEPLYVLALGAITNVASAMLMAPDIVDNIVIVWLGGHPPYWPDTREFNLRQDVAAAQVILDSGAAVVQIPCALVAEQLRTTLPEMERHVRGQGVVGDYLYGIYRDYVPTGPSRSKVIWDISTVAYLAQPDSITSDLCPSPVLLPDATWGPVEPSRHPIRIVRHIDRDLVYGDLFARIKRAATTRAS